MLRGHLAVPVPLLQLQRDLRTQSPASLPAGEKASGPRPGAGTAKGHPEGPGPHVFMPRALFCHLAPEGTAPPGSTSCRLPGAGPLLSSWLETPGDGARPRSSVTSSWLAMGRAIGMQTNKARQTRPGWHRPAPADLPPPRPTSGAPGLSLPPLSSFPSHSKPVTLTPEPGPPLRTLGEPEGSQHPVPTHIWRERSPAAVTPGPRQGLPEAPRPPLGLRPPPPPPRQDPVPTFLPRWGAASLLTEFVVSGLLTGCAHLAFLWTLGLCPLSRVGPARNV